MKRLVLVLTALGALTLGAGAYA
ncbi:MAG: hypothetical protein RJB53_1022, partial [Pseudomonadota bacterium]